MKTPMNCHYIDLVAKFCEENYGSWHIDKHEDWCCSFRVSMLENYNKDQHFGDRWGKCWSGSSAEFYIKRCYDFKEAYIEMLSGSIYKDQIIYHPLDEEIHRLKKHLEEKE